jgi:hypothetical protein
MSGQREADIHTSDPLKSCKVLSQKRPDKRATGAKNITGFYGVGKYKALP